MSSLSPAALQALGALMIASPGGTQTSDEVTQAAQTATPGSPLHQAYQLASNAPVVNPQSMQTGAVEAANPQVTAAEGLGEMGQQVNNTQNTADAAMGDNRRAGEAEKKATELRVDAMNQDANSAAQIHQENAAHIQKMQQDFATIQTDIRGRTETAFTNYLQASKNYSSTHVHDWWGSAPTGAQVLGVISQALAGGLQGLTGNLGSETPLDRIIRNDVEMQKFQIQQEGEKANVYRNQFKDLTEQFNNEVLAEQALYTAAYESTKQRIESQLKAAGAGPGTAAYKYGQALIQDCDAKIARNTQLSRVQINGMVSNTVMADAHERLDYAKIWNTANANAKPQVGITGIQGAEALSPDQQKEVQAKVQGGVAGYRASTEAANLLDQAAKGNVSLRELAPQLAQKLGQLQLTQRQQDAIRAVGGGGEELVNALSGGPTTLADYFVDESRGRSPAQRAALFRGLANIFQKTAQQDVGSYKVNGQKLKLDWQAATSEQ